MKNGFITLKFKLSPLGTVTSKFGEVSSVHPQPHTGIDLSCPIGTELHSPVDGIVMRIVDQDSGLGKGIFIKTQDGYQFIFGHLSAFKASVGERVHTGDVIGLSGSTGHSTGPHIHIGLRDPSGHFINPESYPFIKHAFTHIKDTFSDIIDVVTECV